MYDGNQAVHKASFYDDEKYKVCPICLSLSSQNHENEDRTVAYTTPLDDAADKTIGYQALKDDAVAKPTVDGSFV